MTNKPLSLRDLLNRTQRINEDYGVNIDATVTFDMDGQKFVLDLNQTCYTASKVTFKLVKDDTVTPLSHDTKTCDNCHNHFHYYRSQYHNPWRTLDMEEGVFLQLTCPHCFKKQDYYFTDENIPDHVDLSNVMLTAP